MSLEDFREEVKTTLEQIFAQPTSGKFKVTEDLVEIISAVDATRDINYETRQLLAFLSPTREESLDRIYLNYFCELPTEDIPQMRKILKLPPFPASNRIVDITPIRKTK